MRFSSPQTEDEWNAYYDVRYRVLRKPWGAPLGSERDATDAESYNVMMYNNDGVLVGVARLHFNTATEAQVRYVAVEDGFQNAGLGALLMKHMEEYAIERGATCMVLEAREKAVPFYKRLGYVLVKESYLLFGEIQHYTMTKELCA